MVQLPANFPGLVGRRTQGSLEPSYILQQKQPCSNTTKAPGYCRQGSAAYLSQLSILLGRQLRSQTPVQLAMDSKDLEEVEAPLSPSASSSSSVSDQQPQAPAFKIPSRTIAAVEHPFLVKNLDKGIETFGSNPQFQSVCRWRLQSWIL